MPLPLSGHHECTLSETNRHGQVWCCTCGDIGPVVPCPTYQDHKSKRLRRDPDLAMRKARELWRQHYLMKHVPLVPPDLTRAVPGLTRIGRFGQP